MSYHGNQLYEHIYNHGDYRVRTLGARKSEMVHQAYYEKQTDCEAPSIGLRILRHWEMIDEPGWSSVTDEEAKKIGHRCHPRIADCWGPERSLWAENELADAFVPRRSA